MPEQPRRESWSGTAGFILASVGMAVGLGNLWRFSYTASAGGGAAFVVVYLIIVFAVGVPLLTAEMAIGYHTGLSPVRAMGRVGGGRWNLAGVMFGFVGFAILSVYAVIMGWTMRLLIDSVRGAVPQDTASYFAAISTGPDAMIFQFVSVGLTMVIVQGGIRGGIERVARLLMPLLFVLLVGLAVWAATLSGGGRGYAFYLKPDLAALLDVDVLVGAAGQAFFSLSLGMGALITFASYLERRKINLPRQAGAIALADTSVALVGGLITFPVIFHFGMENAVDANAFGTLFIAFPRAFHSMGASGTVVAGVFFVALYIAAITSSIAMLEVATSATIDGWGWPRKRATLLLGGGAAAAGIPSALNPSWMALQDKVVGEVALLAGGILIAVLTGWIWSRGADETLAEGFPYPTLRRGWRWLLRTVIPALLAIFLFLSIRQLGPLVQAL